jgi:hypothetical protein
MCTEATWMLFTDTSSGSRSGPICYVVMYPGRQTTDDNIIWRMRFACWITKATDTQLEYAMLIAFIKCIPLYFINVNTDAGLTTCLLVQKLKLATCFNHPGDHQALLQM